MLDLIMSLAVPMLSTSIGVSAPQDTTRIFEVTATTVADWAVVNDGVMGGLSSSEFVDSGAGFAVFRGELSLDNNGGFASVRGIVPIGAMESHSGLALRVRGDGRSYQVRLRTNQRFDGVAYMAEFPTRAGAWQTIEIPFEAFEATFRGRKPRGAPDLVPGEIRQLGLLIGDKVEGPFRLDVEWIRPVG
ncbi:MAG: CIA30 family protein [Gemmatimonadota bacterium]|jgi:monofunctional biosynthetic peptidoglycan transglycosylase